MKYISRVLILLSIYILGISPVFAQTKKVVKKKTAPVATQVKRSTPKPPPAVPAFQSNANNAFFPTATNDQENDEYLTASKYRISDASFIVLPKQKFVRYSVMFRPDRTERMMNDKGFTMTTITQTFWNFQADGEYGLTPNLRVGAIINWQIYGSQYLKVAGLQESYSSKAGFQDPDLKAVYRLMDSKNSSFNSDFSLHFIPSLGTAKAALADQVGNAIYGGNQVMFGLNAIIPDPNFEWIFSGTGHFLSKADVEGSSAATSYDIDSHFRYWFDATLRKHFLVRYFADLTLEARMPYSTNTNYHGATAVTYYQEVPLHIVPKIQVAKELSSEGMVRVGYRYEGYITDDKNKIGVAATPRQTSISEGSLFAELDLLY